MSTIRHFYILGLLLLYPAFFSFGQNTILANTGKLLINAGYPEETIIHYNSPVLFSGEYLYYKLYNIHSIDKTPADISKIAYVELIAEDGNRIFRHKLDLREGTGAGDFFIPTATPSGNYKLVGYTTWTLNNPNRPFFQGDITIINPYTNDQGQLLQTDASVVKEEGAGLQRTASAFSESLGPFSLTTNRNSFSPREQVTLSISSPEEVSPAIAELSVSVRLLDTLTSPAVVSFPQNPEAAPENGQAESQRAVYLPELRGEIISGRVLATDGAPVPANELQIAVSIPGKNFLLKIVNVNRNGEFLISLDQPHTGDNGFLQILGTTKDSYTIEIDPKPRIDYASLEFSNFTITPEMQEMIRTRSIYNQIENSYYAVKPDTILPPKDLKPFYGDQITHYDLDAYTRFKTLRETFVEIIQFAHITTNRGEARINVRGLDPHSSGQPTLLVVDGQLIEDHDHVVNMEATKIKSIAISRDRYFLGPQVFNGIVHIQTGTGDYANSSGYAGEIDLIQSQAQKRYFNPSYDNSAQDLERIPDFRHQLFWLPELQIKGSRNLSFFTSDVKGDFIIEVAGFTTLGQPVSLKKVISVR